jgi:hypothetical protein
MKKIRIIGVAILLSLWAVLTAFVWFAPAKEMSNAERRPLAQLPELSADTLLSGKFMANFEEFTQDQFPGRDLFRQLKSLFHYNVMGQLDNNDIYIADGYAAKMEYPLNKGGLNNAIKRFNEIYDRYLKDSGSKIYSAVIPDNGYYLAEKNGYLAMDYETLFETVRQGLPWAEHIDLTDCLTEKDYYRTDTHWRQEALLPVAERLCGAMGMTVPRAEEFVKTAVDRPFYGVYYGQAALPMQPETLYIMESQRLSSCTVYRYDTDDTGSVYDMEKISSRDLYDVYLSGPQSLLRIDNPNAKTDRELIVFRDSFGSSLIPLLVQDYKTVTVVDIRYIPAKMLAEKIAFNGQDVLFLYSTLILNTGSALR